MLYYLKQEVIGEHADSVLKGAHIRCVKLQTLRQRAEQGPRLEPNLLRFSFIKGRRYLDA